ncbi:hypothetical protein [Gottfriedia solisilvae]|uniref:Uncharacterized protein n=1 Tax=Gottfriedia solisilvae TaxID=1516104 RepID=A0A8J3F057_9BACI|nr:hypothetical protein [Gottfriedia solisilvae]GGI17645.1 hypothetical protein GCM10007380_38980 [Gottfriedia solisilvae]
MGHDDRRGAVSDIDLNHSNDESSRVSGIASSRMKVDKCDVPDTAFRK